MDDGARAVAVVGTRRASAEGLEVARELGRGLAAAGITVVSGMALGVDSAAHAGALEAGGPTVAVLAGGADRASPASKRALHRELVARHCVLSELPPGFAPHRWCFPARNRTIAALAAATVVVEAAERSGSLITAEVAADLGREVAAVPGSPLAWRSAGTNALLRDGATLVRDARDVLDAVLGVTRDGRARDRGRGDGSTRSRRFAGIDPSLRAVLASVVAGRDTVAALAPTPGDVGPRRRRAQRARAARGPAARGRRPLRRAARRAVVASVLDMADADRTALLDEQARYYAARAEEYDDWWFRRGRYDRGPEATARWRAEAAEVEAALAAFGPRGDVLELACGTGLWTEHLARHADRVDAVDAAPEVLEVARRRLDRSPGRAEVRLLRGRPLRLVTAAALRRRRVRPLAVPRPRGALRGVLALRRATRSPPVAGPSSSTAAARPARRRPTTCSPEPGRTRWSAASTTAAPSASSSGSGSRTPLAAELAALGWRTELAATDEFFVFGSAERRTDRGAARRAQRARAGGLSTVPGPAARHAAPSRPLPVCLSIAGSDSGGGAGIQADLKAFAAAGVHGTTAITAITAQNTVAVEAVEAVSPGMVVAQVRAVVEDLGVDAVKVGMLGSAVTTRAVADALDLLPPGTPVVVDPVMVAESGARLLEADAQMALVALILPRATVVTPNLPEARVLAGDAAGAMTPAELAEAILLLGPGAVARDRRAPRGGDRPPGRRPDAARAPRRAPPGRRRPRLGLHALLDARRAPRARRLAPGRRAGGARRGRGGRPRRPARARPWRRAGRRAGDRARGGGPAGPVAPTAGRAAGRAGEGR